MTNFDFLLAEERFVPFSSVAVTAEEICRIDFALCVLNCRRAMEFAVQWMFSVDEELPVPPEGTPAGLLDTQAFRELVGEELWRCCDLIRGLGSVAAWSGETITEKQAVIALKCLHAFLSFVSCAYARDPVESVFNPMLWMEQTETLPDNSVAVNFEGMLLENAGLRGELTARRKTRQCRGNTENRS